MLKTRVDRSPDMPRTAYHIALALALAAALGASGCGRKGRLEPPPGQLATPAKDAKAPSDPGIVKPKTPFILDPLLN
jgi:predicted small lipoprotein YifL